MEEELVEELAEGELLLRLPLVEEEELLMVVAFVVAEEVSLLQ